MLKNTSPHTVSYTSTVRAGMGFLGKGTKGFRKGSDVSFFSYNLRVLNVKKNLSGEGTGRFALLREDGVSLLEEFLGVMPDTEEVFVLA